MALQDWIHKYPYVQRLWQQDAVEDLVPLGSCCAMTWARERGIGAPLPPVPCDAPAEEVARDGQHFCGYHFARVWLYPCCGAQRDTAVAHPWGEENDIEWHGQGGIYWCEECYDRCFGS